MGYFGKLARPREAMITLSVSAVLFVGAAYLASERHVGDLHAGAPELRPEARFNQDINEITKRYNVTTDVLVVITEALATGGLNPCRSTYVVDAQNNLHWYLENIPGVTKVISLSSIAKTKNGTRIARGSSPNPSIFSIPNCHIRDVSEQINGRNVNVQDLEYQ